MLANVNRRVWISGPRFHNRIRRLISQYHSCPKLVLLGTGWGSYSVLRYIDHKKYDITVISPRNHFLFTPLLASTTVGTLEFRSIVEPIRKRHFLFAKKRSYHEAHATDIDLKNKIIECHSDLRPGVVYKEPYDYLVIGVGALSNTWNVPGVQEHAFFLKELADARRIRNRILSNFELAVQPEISDKESERLLHTVIVGGGPTGIEFGAELYDFVKEDVSRLYPVAASFIKVTLIESKKILASFDSRLQALAEKKFKQREHFHLLQSSVIEINKDTIKLINGEIIPCGLVVWSTGLAPRDFTKKLNVQKTKHGQILVDNYLKVLDYPNDCAFAIGDCACLHDDPLPQTAQVAERQGKYLANVLNKMSSKEAVKPFKFKSIGMLTYIGNWEALTDLPDIKLGGKISWVLWRSAYATRLGSWRLRMQVPLDWMKTFIFGRDISRF